MKHSCFILASKGNLMSQAGRFLAGSPLPEVETLTGDGGGAVGVDAAFNIFVRSSTNNPGAGLTIIGNTEPNTLDVQLNEVFIATADGTLTNLTTLTVPASRGVVFDLLVIGIVTPGYNIVLNGKAWGGAYRAPAGGVVITDLTEDYQSNSLVAPPAEPRIFVTTAGNDLLFQVRGTAAVNYNWRGNLRYIIQS